MAKEVSDIGNRISLVAKEVSDTSTKKLVVPKEISFMSTRKLVVATEISFATNEKKYTMPEPRKHSLLNFKGLFWAFEAKWHFFTLAVRKWIVGQI